MQVPRRACACLSTYWSNRSVSLPQTHSFLLYYIRRQWWRWPSSSRVFPSFKRRSSSWHPPVALQQSKVSAVPWWYLGHLVLLFLFLPCRSTSLCLTKTSIFGEAIQSLACTWACDRLEQNVQVAWTHMMNALVPACNMHRKTLKKLEWSSGVFASF